MSYGQTGSLSDYLTEMQRNLPQDLEDGWIMTDVYLEDSYVCFQVNIDDSQTTLDMLKYAKSTSDDFEKAMLEGLRNSSAPSDKLLLDNVVKAGMGIKYIFRTKNSYERVTFIITPEMMAKNKAVEVDDDDDFVIEVLDYEEVEEEEEEEEEAFPSALVEEKPLFQGGDVNTFSKWVNQRLVYPEIAKKNGVQGRVVLGFIIETDGSVSNVKVLRGVDSSLDKEAVRLVSSSPKWTPGKYRGLKVRVKYTFPVMFQLR